MVSGTHGMGGAGSGQWLILPPSALPSCTRAAPKAKSRLTDLTLLTSIEQGTKESEGQQRRREWSAICWP